MKIVKHSGDIVDFNPNKLKLSLLKSGASNAMVNDVLQTIEKEIYDGIPTKQIYKMAFGLLKRISNSIRKTLIEWSFKPMDNTELSWQGIINSADLFRFYSMLRNWIGYIDYLNMSYDHHEGGAL